MPSKRRSLERKRKAVITDDMVLLFKTGLEILRNGDDEAWEDDTPPGRRREFLNIDKRLNWTLLRRDPHEVSVLDSDIAEGNPPPPYKARYDKNGSFYGWDTALAQRAALMDALKKRSGHT